MWGVAVGIIDNDKWKEIVGLASMDSDHVIRCFAIDVSIQD